MKAVVWIVCVGLVLMIVAIGFLGFMELNTKLYVLDKGCVVSYVDEYEILHDDVFWLVVGGKEKTYTVFVSPLVWYKYSVGQRFTGQMRNCLIYEGDDSIVRSLSENKN